MSNETPGGMIRVPLSLAQEQMWWMEKYAPGPGFFNQPVRHRFPSAADPALLAEALGCLTERHESLRTTFPLESGEPYQSIAPSVAVEVPVTDLRCLAPEDRRRQLIRLEVADVEIPFDTVSGPLFRAHLFLLGDDLSEVLVVFDHLVSDPTSEAIFVSELDEVYAALSAGVKPALRPVEIDYADFAVWQRQWMTDERVREYKQHWATVLKGVSPVRRIPYTSAVRDPALPGRSDLTLPPAMYTFTIPADVCDALRRLPGFSGYVACTAAVAALVARSTGETDTLLATSVGGRDRAELSGIIGDFGGLSLLRTDLSGDPTFEVILERAQAAVLGVLEHQHLPLYESLNALSEEGTDNSFASIPGAVHFFHAAHPRWVPGTSVIARPPEREGLVEIDLPEESRPLEFRFFDDGTTLWGDLLYHRDHYDDATGAQVVADLKALLGAVAKDPSLRLSQLPRS